MALIFGRSIEKRFCFLNCSYVQVVSTAQLKVNYQKFVLLDITQIPPVAQFVTYVRKDIAVKYHPMHQWNVPADITVIKEILHVLCVLLVLLAKMEKSLKDVQQENMLLKDLKYVFHVQKDINVQHHY